MVDRLGQVDEDVPKYYGKKAKIHKGIQLCEAKNPDYGLPGDSEVQASQYDFNTDLYKTGATDCCKTESGSSEVSVIEDLKAWTVSFQVRHNALDSLLRY